MPFTPEFMLHLDQFRKEREAVRTLDDWETFDKKWLDNTSWPTKTADVLREEGKRKRGPVSIGGRSWGFTDFNDDISPEARYEYFYTLATVGDPINFPDEKSVPKTADEGFRQECPYCEIWTDEIGDDVCPKCRRKLVFGRSSD
jgi:hypothetical protein